MVWGLRFGAFSVVVQIRVEGLKASHQTPENLYPKDLKLSKPFGCQSSSQGVPEWTGKCQQGIRAVHEETLNPNKPTRESLTLERVQGAQAGSTVA